MINLKPISGRLTSFEGTDFPVGVFGAAQTIVSVFPSVLTAPSGGSFDVELRTAAGTLPTSIPDGLLSPATLTTGSLAVDAGETVQMRITQASGAEDFSGWFEVAAAAPAPGGVVYLTTLAEVKAFLALSTSEHDTALTSLIIQVSAAIQRWLSRSIVQVAITGERHDGGWRRVSPCEYPVTAITQVTDSGSVLDAADTRISSDGRFIERVSDWQMLPFLGGTQNVELDYTAGYVVVPDDVVMAATKQVAHEWNQGQPSGQGRVGLVAVSQASGSSSSFISGVHLLPEVEAALFTYKALL